MRAMRLGLLALAVLASALMAGFFYAYQVSVMPGLADAGAAVAIAAMQGINRTVRTAVFASAFFGTLPFGLAAALALGRSRAAPFAWAGTALYAAGAFAVTFAANVPLNESLAALGPAPPDPAAAWSAFAEPWLRWNLLRTMASLAALACFATALARAWRD